MTGSDNPYETFLAVIIGSIVVFLQHSGTKLITRSMIAGCSGGIGFLVGPEITIPYVGIMGAHIVVTMFSYVVIDTVFGLIRDRELVRSVVRRFAKAQGDD